jgi:tetratricopeptide (TPR) repeat protein
MNERICRFWLFIFSHKRYSIPMKRFLFLSLVFTVTLHAQNSKPAEKAVSDLSTSQKEFLNLPEEKRKEFIEYYHDAQRLLTTKRVFETLEALDNAENIFSKSVELYNLRGSCYVEMRIFDKAEVAFKKALEVSPNNPSVMFNVGESMFVSGQWQASHDVFQKILKMLPPNAMAMSRLIEFKILLCKKKLGLDQEVRILTDKYDYQDDSPFYYYAKAVVAFDEKELVEAEQWMARASRIFRDPNVLTPWQDTMIEYGYIKSFFRVSEEPYEEP